MRNQKQTTLLLLLSRALPLQLLALSSLLLFAGCAQLSMPSSPETSTLAEVDAEIELETAEVVPEAIPEPQEDPEPEKLYEWNGAGRSISHVVIDTNAQRARFYDGREQVGWTTIASGVSAHPTPSGEFQIMEKVAKKRSNLYGRIYNAKGGLHKRNARSSDPIPAGGKFVGANMPNFMRMTYDGIGIHAGAIPNPGQPASHGCIRLPNEVASSLFAHTNIGTRVTVIGNGPDYGNYAERIRRQREQAQRDRVAVASANADTNAEPRRPRSTSETRGTSSADSSSSSSERASNPSEAEPTQTASRASQELARPERTLTDAATIPARNDESSNNRDDRLASNENNASTDAETADTPQAAVRSQSSSPESASNSNANEDREGAHAMTTGEANRSAPTGSGPAESAASGSGSAESRSQAAAPETSAAPAEEPRAQPQKQRSTPIDATSTAAESPPSDHPEPAASPRANRPSPAPQPLQTAPPRTMTPKAPEIRSADGGESSDDQG
ncbi:MAG: L,D-transpeptidase family protein [Lamprobacter sp.]|uniref:L,D-transpeptidase family protein n=1 Tax=Lamprobacter sp. TaxID=3100796 RepID=UPI002B25C7FF|nr:L,D-transpeptidase family protein [Lamprobacter sp.]MEA3640164.1 L,D-transpeptidase family protein [Lamprobacter sp.]